MIDQQVISFMNTTQTLKIDSNYPLDKISVKIVNKGISVFNINYSPFPRVNLTFNQGNALFWPEPILDSNGDICQSSPPMGLSYLLTFYVGNKVNQHLYTKQISSNENIY